MQSSNINPSGAPASAADRIDQVIDTAERAAAEIRADEQAQRQAEAMARERVTMISELTEALIEHATLVATQCEGLIRALESTMQRREAGATAASHAEPLEVARDAPPSEPSPAPESESEPAANLEHTPKPEPEPAPKAEPDAPRSQPFGAGPASSPAWPPQPTSPPRPATPPPERPAPPPPASAPAPPPASWPRRDSQREHTAAPEPERPPVPQPPPGPDPAPPPAPPPEAEPSPAEPPAPAPMAEPPQEPPAWDPPSLSHAGPATAIPAEAYLRATRLALDGRGRAEIGEELRAEFGIDDPEPILDRILGAA